MLLEQSIKTNIRKVAHTRLPSVGFRSRSRFLAVSLQVTWVINPVVGCHYFPPDPQLPPQPLRGLLPVLLLGEQRHNGCEKFAWDCYPTASRLRFEPGPFCTRVQHANHSATEPPKTNIVFMNVPLKLLSPEAYSVQNALNIIWQPGSAWTRWGSLQRSPRLPSWI